MSNLILFPKSNWTGLVDSLKHLRIPDGTAVHPSDIDFLKQLGYVDESGLLTATGMDVCKYEFVTRDTEQAGAIHYQAIASLPATQAILQSLWGVDDINVEQVKNALLFVGVEQNLLSKNLVNFLTILNKNGVITYNRKFKTVKLLIAPLEASGEKAPDHIYIDSSRPYSNDFYIRKIIKEARGKLMWLDKYFQKEGFTWLWREADASNLHTIQIVSSSDGTTVDPVTKEDYKKLRKELAARSINLEWRTLKRNESHDFHDRWILDTNGMCYNIPSINSIKSGQRSELHKSPNGKDINEVFDSYFAAASPAIG